jgi:hypothetical protein
MPVSFMGAHFPQEIVLTGVRWVINYSPQLEEACHHRTRPV